MEVNYLRLKVMLQKDIQSCESIIIVNLIKYFGIDSVI
jgi:hypothetical protein